METACIGSVVRSISGRDKKRVFLIVGVCSDGSGRVLVADGELHKLSKPKKKNLSHLAVLAAAVEGETSTFEGSDRELCLFLENFEKEIRNKS